MKYYVYHSWGSCNEGDHSWSLEVCDNLREAEDWVRYLRNLFKHDLTVHLIHGDEYEVTEGK